MLLRHRRIRTLARPTRQRGVVLLIALIVLVALTLAGVALIRSVNTTNLIAGNMSFHESAVQAGERGTEAAVQWMVANPADLIATTSPVAWYVPLRQDPAEDVAWEAFWDTLSETLTPATGAPDAAGNTVAYLIHRLCDAAGPPATVNCATPPAGADAGDSMKPGAPIITNKKIYYRVTTRVTGPRNTVAFIQTIIAL